MQVKLLRVLQERSLRPVGGTSEVAVDVRVIAATNKHLDDLVAQNLFREDLYYRLSVIPVEAPPLRERREDIPLLANHFLKKYAPAAGKNILRISPESIEDLCDYNWPGNVRQLENTIERAVALEATDELHVDVPVERSKRPNAGAFEHSNGNGNGHGNGVPSLPNDGLDLEAYIEGLERGLIQSALKQSNGVQTRAAELLHVSYRSFRHLLKKYEI